MISAGLAGVGEIAGAVDIRPDVDIPSARSLRALRHHRGGISAAARCAAAEGTILGVAIGAAIIRTMDNGINMFKIGYTDAQGHPQSWHLNDNWRNLIIGLVILAAVILDQVSHLMRNRKRTIGAVAASAPPAATAAIPPAG